LLPFYITALYVEETLEMEKEKIKSYRDLQVWQKAVEIAVLVYQITGSFPKSEQYGLSSQMQRAAVSVASNIAEGHCRSRKHFGNYLETALGSLAELETQAEFARRINYLPESTYLDLSNKLTALGRQLNTLHQRITA
jgi:four helix bundle protein